MALTCLSHNYFALLLYLKLEKLCQHCPVRLPLNAAIRMTKVLAPGREHCLTLLVLMRGLATWKTEQVLRR